MTTAQITEQSNKVVVEEQSLGTLTISGPDSVTTLSITEPLTSVNVTQDNVTVQISQQTAAQVVVAEAKTPVEIKEDVIGVLTITTQGPQGVPGVNGGAYYVHNQVVVADTWTIEHDLGKKPSVTIVDSADTVVVGEIQYLDDNNLTVSFGAEFTGKAYLN